MKKDPQSGIESFRQALVETTQSLDWSSVARTILKLREIRDKGGRVFVLGLGGSAGNAGHMVNDLRKLTSIEAYAPTDNVSEMTARINDDGWGNAFTGWLKISKLSKIDAVFLLSVGGGDLQLGVSPEIVHAADYAKSIGAEVLGVVGRNGGHVGTLSKNIIIVPPVNPEFVTPLAEAFQAIVWHAIVSSPFLATSAAHWESLETK